MGDEVFLYNLTKIESYKILLKIDKVRNQMAFHFD